MSAAEKIDPLPASGEAPVSELRAFLRPIGSFEFANHGSMSELTSALIIGHCNSVEELVDRLLKRVVTRIDEATPQMIDQPIDRDQLSVDLLNAENELRFIRELLRRCFAEGVLEERL